MFRRRVTPLSEILNELLRKEGLETPLLQRRLIAAWDDVVGTTVVRYTTHKYIRNQTLYVKISNPALRADLSMMRMQLVRRLNEAVGGMVIVDVRFG